MYHSLAVAHSKCSKKKFMFSIRGKNKFSSLKLGPFTMSNRRQTTSLRPFRRLFELFEKA